MTTDVDAMIVGAGFSGASCRTSISWGPYRAKCDMIADNGDEGFAIDGEARPTSDGVYQWAVTA